MEKIIIFAMLTIALYGIKAQDFKSKKEIDRFENNSFTPYGNGAFGNMISNLALTSALKSGVNGKIEVKTKIKSDWVAGLTVEQAVGKDDREATFYEFSKGLTAGTKVSLNIQWTRWRPWKTSKAFRDSLDILKQAYVERHPEITNYQNVQIPLIKTDPELKDKIPAYPKRNPFFFKLDAGFQRNKFEYTIDSVTLDKINEKFLSPQVSFSVGYVLSNSSYVAVNYIYAESYKSADEVEFLRKFGTTDNLYGQTIAFGKPSFEQDHRTSIEYRKNFNEKFALAPSVTYGIESKKMAFSLPLYFIKGVEDDKPTGLQGGVNLGYLTGTDGKWSSFKDGFSAQLIVSAPFSVFGDLFD